jgi:transcriptional regulator GlxA family with amidase domain
MDRRIQTVIALIEARLSTRQHTSAIARAVNLSPSRLRHLFKRETGCTISQYLTQLKIQRAEFLLRTSFLSVKQISNQVGITSSGRFVREFKKAYGSAPSEYRKRLVEKR